MLSPDLWNVLLSLNKAYDVVDNAVIITSDVISKNGFKIEVQEGKVFCTRNNHVLCTDPEKNMGCLNWQNSKKKFMLRKKISAAQGFKPIVFCTTLRQCS